MLGVAHPVLPALTAGGVRDVAAGAAALGSFAASVAVVLPPRSADSPAPRPNAPMGGHDK